MLRLASSSSSPSQIIEHKLSLNAYVKFHASLVTSRIRSRSISSSKVFASFSTDSTVSDRVVFPNIPAKLSARVEAIFCMRFLSVARSSPSFRLKSRI
jgi:hypothetical protein